jgi:hypothetical protein
MPTTRFRIVLKNVKLVSGTFSGGEDGGKITGNSMQKWAAGKAAVTGAAMNQARAEGRRVADGV